MLSTLLFAAAIACNTDTDRALQLVVHVDSDRFFAYNPTSHAELLLFTDTASGTRAVVALAAFAETDYRCPDSVRGSIDVQVVASDAAGLVYGGRWSLEDLYEQSNDGVWLEATHSHAHGWTHDGSGWLGLDAIDAGTGAHSLCTPPPAAPPDPLHVPGITPSDVHQGDLPPRLESKPLPPV
jgi:hypothetical protein